MEISGNLKMLDLLTENFTTKNKRTTWVVKCFVTDIQGVEDILPQSMSFSTHIQWRRIWRRASTLFPLNEYHWTNLTFDRRYEFAEASCMISVFVYKLQFLVVLKEMLQSNVSALFVLFLTEVQFVRTPLCIRTRAV